MNDVRMFGAKGDGITLDTPAIQKAIDAGGMVYFPPGIYCSGTLYLRSCGGLELAPGAVLLASPNPEDYNADDFCPQNRVFSSEKVSGAHFIVALEQHHITIRGGGRIDGNRQAFMEENVSPEHPTIFQLKQWRPGQMIFCCECSNITFENIELFNAPYWTCFLHGCEQVALHNLNIYTDRRTHNGDGIDLDCCRFVSISDCRIDTGDDCLALRACTAPLKQPLYSEFITISNCILRSRCDAIRLGVGDGVIRNVMFSNIIIHDTNTCINITSQYSAKSIGVQIENIDFNNIQFISCARPLLICSHTLGPQNTPAKKKIAHLHFSGIHGEASFSSFIEGNCRKDIQDIRFTNLHLRYFGGNEIQASPNGDRTGSAVPAAFWINHATGICFENSSLKWIPEASSLWKWSIHASDADIEVSNCSLDKKMMEQ